MEEKENEKKGEEKENKESNLIYALIFISVILIFVFYISFKTYHYKQLKEKCEAIQNSPYLLYPCKCFPTTHSSLNKSGFLARHTKTFCTCVCNINGTKEAFEIRIAENSSSGGFLKIFNIHNNLGPLLKK